MDQMDAAFVFDAQPGGGDITNFTGANSDLVKR